MSIWAIIGLILMGLFLIKAFWSASDKSGQNESSIGDFSSSEHSDGSGSD